MTISLNAPFSIPKEELEEKINSHIGESTYTHIVPPTHICSIDKIEPLPITLLDALLRKVPLKNTTTYPYCNATITLKQVDTRKLYTGQTFVLHSKLQRTYFLGDTTNLEPQLISGRTPQHHALAFYLPPIVEHHQDKDIIIDGIHRTYSCFSTQTPLRIIYLEPITTPLPFQPFQLDKVQVFEEKPPIPTWYQQFQEQYYRDFCAMGLDG